MSLKIRIHKKLKNEIKNHSGMTLVELIVVFALMGIFMIAATFMLSTSIQLFSRMQATSQAVTVSDLILDKIAGEIAAADIPAKDATGGHYFWLENDNGSPWVAFCNRSGSPVSIYADNDNDAAEGFGQGQLFMKHYKMSEDDKKKLNEINWHFDKQVYMNYQISELKFSRPEPAAHPNVVKIDLTLTNEKTGFAYSTVRYAENYNFDFSTDYMCVRNDGGTGLPKEAEEFRIEKIPDPDNPDPDPEDPDDPEIQQISFTVLHKVEGKETILLEEKLKKDLGTYFWIGPKGDISGYTPKSAGFSLPITEEEEGAVYTLWYTENAYKYLIKGCIAPPYRYNYTIQDAAGRYWGTAEPIENEGILYTQPGTLLYSQLNTDPEALQTKPGYTLAYNQIIVKEGDGSTSPVVENGFYVVGAKSTYEPVTEIPYMPQDVTLRMYGKCEGEVLFTVDLGVKYGSKLHLENSWKVPGYECKESAKTISVEQTGMMETTWEYVRIKEVDAPFPPKGPETVVTPSGMSDIHEKFGDELRKFFEEGWVIGKTNKNVEIGYHVFTYEGTRYVVAGYCEMEGNQSINSQAKWIAEQAGVSEDNIINITSMEDGMRETDILWKYLLSLITDATESEKNLILNSSNRAVSFVKRDSGNTNYYYLESVSYTISGGQTITITYR